MPTITEAGDVVTDTPHPQGPERLLLLLATAARIGSGGWCDGARMLAKWGRNGLTVNFGQSVKAPSMWWVELDVPLADAVVLP